MPKRSADKPIRRYPLHIHIAWLFILLIVVFAAANTWYNDRQASRMLLTASRTLFNQIGAQTAERLDNLYRNAGTSVDLLANTQLLHAQSLQQRLHSLPYLQQLLRNQPALTAAYAGYANGDFFLLRRVPDNATFRKTYTPPLQARWLLQSIETLDGQREGRFLYYDDQLRLLENRLQPDYRYDPRTRAWYAAARLHDGHIFTEPYVFFTTREPGATFARQVPDGAVAGIDVTLAQVSQLLRQKSITAHSELALIGPHGNVLAYREPDKIVRPEADGSLSLVGIAELGVPAIAALMGDRSHYADAAATLHVEGEDWYGYVARIAVDGPGDQLLHLAMAAPQRELLADARQLRFQTMLIALILLAVAVPVAMWFSRLASRPIQALINQARAIQAMRFDTAVETGSVILEIHELAHSMQQMQATIEQFRDIGDALADERDFDQLLARILTETVQMAQAQSGIVYLTEPDGSLHARQACQQDQCILLSQPLPVLHLASDPLHPALLAQTSGQTWIGQIETGPLNTWFHPLQRFGQPRTLVAIPLSNRQAQSVGVLLLFLADGQAEPGLTRMALLEAVSGTAAVALETQRLIQEQQALLESFIQLVAGAIDAKSPYTGGHCQRVPELARMLAEAACAARDGPYADFAMNEEEWQALHIAAWLHDCGKVTTPEYVVDKATRLETLYDRIHEIRTRFEVLKRDAEIAYWQGVAQGGDKAALAEIRDQMLATLDREFALVARSNQGGEGMDAADVDQLQQIAQRQWQRTLDDRIGLSHEELTRKQAVPPAPLPATENLLADKPEHLFERGPRDQLPQGHGFVMDVPALLYNRGELHNLCLGRGTLTAEERYKINEHIIQTIVMLEKLPFPRHLRNVPEIAAGHHEKMDGTGYPRRLTREQMSPLARMMAIADIFEALTAVDRPYKQGKTLSEALAIMARMRSDGHIDAELFELFLRGGVYLHYAKVFLRPEQLDAVDITQYL
ncbi:HD domain-containing phosphohydrolase [Amantichitinum ursilacus]|uniref:Cyclic di-GMP phosphodiesterase response regulator RpfG n=1 Tax=Amantichitinum ursilacus TaxID=857265 RepID=A0A0N1JSS9_9NEIS|nr:HD domain-containing phosphohydrolase [Amantichitinum ursilacus]KPC53280.1 Cyclic di-GMP phosphodiesterase response regulator RpfG [Amantichitinum ursilacus]